jgi:hypothetical protein
MSDSIAILGTLLTLPMYTLLASTASGWSSSIVVSSVPGAGVEDVGAGVEDSPLTGEGRRAP